MASQAIGRIGYCRTIVRSIKTLHTPVLKTNELATRVALMEGIELLDKAVNSTSYNKSLISTGKYRSKPEIITSQDTLRLQHVVKELLAALQMEEAMSGPKMFDVDRKLSKIGLQLFVECHDGNITPMSTALTCVLMEQYNKSPSKETLTGIMQSVEQVRAFLEKRKITVQNREDIDALVDELCHSQKDSETILRVLKSLDYKLSSPDVVRVTKGDRVEDEITVSGGWRFPAGIVDTNEAYLRSLQLREKKLVSIDKDILVLVYDGTLNDAGKILPTLNYASKVQKSVLLIVTGDCLGDALTSITISNNKNRRQGIDSQTIIMKYNSRANGDIFIQENHDLIEYLRLPKGSGSIYSPDFSPYVPSKVCADQFYGKLDTLEATTGEAFLHNFEPWKGDTADSKFLRMTITVKVGGHSELEINQRRSILDNIINNNLCHGLSSGFLPGYGISLAKAFPSIKRDPSADLKTKLGVDSVMMGLTIPMTRALENMYGLNKFQVTDLVSQTMGEQDFCRAALTPNSTAVDVLKQGILEPWNKVDKCLANVTDFIRLLSSCNTIVAQVFEKPKKSNR